MKKDLPTGRSFFVLLFKFPNEHMTKFYNQRSYISKEEDEHRPSLTRNSTSVFMSVEIPIEKEGNKEKQTKQNEKDPCYSCYHDSHFP